MASNTRYLCEVDGHTVLRCPACATDFVHPPPDKATLQAYYDRPAWFEGGERGGYQNYDAQTQSLLPFFDTLLDDFPQDNQPRSVLDIGCGYGTHLERAHQRGWKCFGVEVSSHARKVLHERHASNFFVADNVENIIPHAFDLIVMFDVIEHLSDPLHLFYTLFSKGAITPRTTVAITTPNSRSATALSNPVGWEYRHPPSHLTYFSGQALSNFLIRLHFQSISVRGMHEVPKAENATAFPDESCPLNADLVSFAGLFCKASGSDFASFIQERYVPGTWSKIAEYEHLPRYLFAKIFAKDSRVLDFGCGTGYGSALLARVSDSVLGLDIDAAALQWARQTHRNPVLNFEQRDDLGAGLQDGSFDLITCFEMIEHVPHTMQIDTVRNISRLLTPTGHFLISTPNPEVTALYGANPYHLREMSADEFLELLAPCFAHIKILRQWVAPSILIADQFNPNLTEFDKSASNTTITRPLAFIAVCSHAPLPNISNLCEFDCSIDFIQDALNIEKNLNRQRFANYQNWEKAKNLADQIDAYKIENKNLTDNAKRSVDLLRTREDEKRKLEEEKRKLEEKKRQTEQVLSDVRVHLVQTATELQAIRRTKLFRLRDAVIFQPWGVQKLLRIVYLIAAMITPARLRRKMAPLVNRLKMWFAKTDSSHLVGSNGDAAYVVRRQTPTRTDLPLAVHVIANFMTGGSSRLVIDLHERLGAQYTHSVVTGFAPSPPAYVGMDLTEIRFPGNVNLFVEHFLQRQPDLIHVHYWGDCDEPWYANAINAASLLKIPIIENINTPIAPFLSDAICRYIYVSDYVKNRFGRNDSSHITIHPGSDFSHFNWSPDVPHPDNCVGMVYRLEPDKLNIHSILPFIEVAKKRPRTRILIVGGGSLLSSFQQAVADAGLIDNFEFTGYVSYEELPTFYQRMSVFVAPVWKESFGQVSVFAMNMGVPVVGYNIGAIEEIVADRTILAESEDSDMLSNIIIRLLDEPTERSRIGSFQRNRAQQKFSVEAMIAAYKTVYQAIIAERTSS